MNYLTVSELDVPTFPITRYQNETTFNKKTKEYMESFFPLFGRRFWLDIIKYSSRKRVGVWKRYWKNTSGCGLLFDHL